jgi:hypothetical protein
MITVAILINGQPIMARSAVNQMRTDALGRTLYRVDDGTELWHRRDDGAVELAKMMLGTIRETDTPDTKDGRHVCDECGKVGPIIGKHERIGVWVCQRCQKELGGTAAGKE